MLLHCSKVNCREGPGFRCRRAFQGRGVMFSVSVTISMATVEQVGRHLNLVFEREI